MFILQQEIICFTAIVVTLVGLIIGLVSVKFGAFLDSIIFKERSSIKCGCKNNIIKTIKEEMK